MVGYCEEVEWWFFKLNFIVCIMRNFFIFGEVVSIIWSLVGCEDIGIEIVFCMDVEVIEIGIFGG